MSSPESTTARVNVADRLLIHAAQRPQAVAVAAARGQNYDAITFDQIDRDATAIAHGLVDMGVRPGHRLALLVKPGVEFVTLVFAVLRSGATMVLVDAGLGKKNIVRCLESTRPDGFVAIPQGQALRVLLRKRFPNAKLNVTVGRKWFWGGETFSSLKKRGSEKLPSPAGGGVGGGGQSSAAMSLSGAGQTQTNINQPNEQSITDNSPPPLAPPPAGERDFDELPTPNHQLPTTTAEDLAAIVFTSGSTGPPKGVCYSHQTFVTQTDEIQSQYSIEPGTVDLACFPLFGLFNVASGVTTILPDMDFSRPASCDPKKLIAAVNHWKCSQAFASPAVWDRLSRYCESTGERLPDMRKVFSCGAPVPAKVIRRTLDCVHPDAELHTPYGATESLPVATIEAREILSETAEKTDNGAGVCVGKKFNTIDWRIIRITDDPIATIEETEELPQGEIGELIVKGPQVSRTYLDSSHHNQLAKITNGDGIWHRMGDVGYLDEQGRFWYCGRKSQRVRHGNGDLFTMKIEPVFNSLPNVKRSALVGLALGDYQEPVLIVEFENAKATNLRGSALWNHWCELVPQIEQLWYGENSFTCFPTVHVHPSLPVDIRHNSKIFREKLAVWVEKKLRK